MHTWGPSPPIPQACKKKNPQRCGGGILMESTFRNFQFYRDKHEVKNPSRWSVPGQEGATWTRVKEFSFFFCILYVFPEVLSCLPCSAQSDLVSVLTALALGLSFQLLSGTSSWLLHWNHKTNRSKEELTFFPMATPRSSFLPLSPSPTVLSVMWLLSPFSLSCLFLQNYLLLASAHFTCLELIFPAKMLIP